MVFLNRMIISSVTISLNGSTIGYGNVHMGTDSATATTTAISSGGACVAAVTYKFGFGSSTYIVSSPDNSAPSSSVTAYSHAAINGTTWYSVTNIGALGEHIVVTPYGDSKSAVTTEGESIY